MPQASINIHTILQDFNPSKFIVYSSLLVFAILFSLRLDNRITISYWLVFLPLWIWKSVAALGALVGVIIWSKNPGFRHSNSSYIHFKSMLISFALQFLLFAFEVLVCDKLESGHYTWTMVFAPVILISLLSIPVCVWSMKNARGIELEFFAAINILQFILIALKLDNFLNWLWVVVFIPSWILMFLAILVVLYAMIFVAITLRSPETGSSYRRVNLHSASSSTMIFLPMLMFMIMLTSKLDSPPNVLTPSYFFTCMPLFVTLFILIRLSFGSRLGSLWWFGMRTDFCTFLLTVCPCLKEYGNTSFNIGCQHNDVVADTNTPSYNPDSLNPQQTPDLNQRPPPDSGDEVYSAHNESNAKLFIRSLSRVFNREKGLPPKDDPRSCPITPELNIHIPD